MAFGLLTCRRPAGDRDREDCARASATALLITGILALGSSSDEPPTARAPVTAVVVFREHDHVPEIELHSAIASPVVSQITTGSLSGLCAGSATCAGNLTVVRSPAKA